ncbi:MAG: HutD family protein [Phyllobacteriaceae bacterium]|nr:HutD family protein [Phyllobacteriaceae bacterium]
MQVLRLADLVAKPWKNGGGSTREYLVHPPGAGAEGFFWRISRARVDRHCAFSIFPGIDRTLSVVEGDTIDLGFRNRVVRLDRTTPPYRFRGEETILCRIPGRAIEDLNVMTDRSYWRHEVTRRRIEAATVLDFAGDHALVVAVSALSADTIDGTIDLAAGDAIHLDAPGRLALAPLDRPGEVLVVRLDHIATARA